MVSKKNNQFRRELIITIAVSFVVLIVTLLITNLPLTGFVTQKANIIEKEIEIEVWADTSIEILKEDSMIKASLILDDGTLLENQELELYLDSQLIVTDKTNSNGYIERNFDLPNTSPGTYSISGIFQGYPTQYLNPTSKEIHIDVNGEEIVKIQNETIPKGCTEFTEDILWLGTYTSNEEGSTKYYNWTPQNNCSEINLSTCIIHDVKTKTRIITSHPLDENYVGFGDVKITELTNCHNPLQGTYTEYLAQDSVKDGEFKLEYYTGEELDLGAKGILENEEISNFNLPCYGIKTHASQYSIVDVFEIKYKLCEQT